MYHNLFYSTLEIALLNNSESFITNILFRLGLLSNVYKTWSEIYQNNMLRVDQHIDSILYHIRKFVSLIDYIAQVFFCYILDEKLIILGECTI